MPYYINHNLPPKDITYHKSGYNQTVKLCIFIALSACLVFYSIAGTVNPQLETLGRGEYRFYSPEIVSSAYITKITDLGFSYIYHCNSRNAAKVRALFTRIDGESITLNGKSARAVTQKLGYRVVSKSSISNVVSVYAYSPRGQVYIQSGGQKINLQIAVNGQMTTVGWPVILGSY